MRTLRSISSAGGDSGRAPETYLSVPVGLVHHEEENTGLHDCPAQHSAPYALKITRPHLSRTEERKLDL